MRIIDGEGPTARGRGRPPGLGSGRLLGGLGGFGGLAIAGVVAAVLAELTHYGWFRQELEEGVPVWFAPWEPVPR